MKRVTHSNPILGTDACYAIAAIGCLSRAFTCVFEQDAAALQVLLEYLSAAEGELWRTVRGKGLAYSYSLYGDIEAGLVYYALSKSSNLPAAFEVGVASLISFFCRIPSLFYLQLFWVISPSQGAGCADSFPCVAGALPDLIWFSTAWCLYDWLSTEDVVIDMRWVVRHTGVKGRV
mgnify:CR=1 FL=1